MRPAGSNVARSATASPPATANVCGVPGGTVTASPGPRSSVSRPTVSRSRPPRTSKRSDCSGWTCSGGRGNAGSTWESATKRPSWWDRATWPNGGSERRRTGGVRSAAGRRSPPGGAFTRGAARGGARASARPAAPPPAPRRGAPAGRAVPSRAALSAPGGLPAVVGEGLVGLRHAEDVVLALVRAALLGLRVEQFVGEPLGHRLLAAVARELDQPPHREGAGPALRDLDGHLVGRAADAP